MENELAGVSAISDPRQRMEQYMYILSNHLSSENVDQAKYFCDHVLSDDAVSRQLLLAIAQELGRFQPEHQIEIFSIPSISSNPASFGSRSRIWSLEKNWLNCMNVKMNGQNLWRYLAALIWIPRLGLQHTLPLNRSTEDRLSKLSICARLAALSQQDGRSETSNAYAKKAVTINNNQQKVPQLQHKVYYARMQELSMKFLSAGVVYYNEICQTEEREFGDFEIDQEALERVLVAAVTCTILAGAGLRRSRLIAAMYKDERCANLKIYPILQKVCLERILRKPEIDAFSETLEPHQKAVLDQVIIEHNIISASRVFKNCSFEGLGTFLGGIAPEEVEKVAAKMIRENRMSGSIDKVDAVIHFESEL
ncbi:COP9 signalosome complex subunit 4 [Salvia divinorum]|uniref:COP9 signalosome complex subunit 4 n=1 Tax=Salvia divinorum TaxID=28513 RepID=A0ABD1IAW6_SALDI